MGGSCLLLRWNSIPENCHPIGLWLFMCDSAKLHYHTMSSWLAVAQTHRAHHTNRTQEGVNYIDSLPITDHGKWYGNGIFPRLLRDAFMCRVVAHPGAKCDDDDARGL